ncbi:DUF2911 domain-containing protein [Flavitalea flava]
MKKVLLMTTILFIGLVACSQTRKSPHDTLETKNIKVTYGRPYKKGREIFGKLEPFGKVYRAGADEATTIAFAKDGTFAGKPVKAGTYTLFVTPYEKQWAIILNSELGQWGAYKYDQFKDKDVLHAEVPVTKADPPVEQFTIRFAGKDMIIEWDNTRVAIPVSIQ